MQNDGNHTSLYGFFVARVKKNLHVVLSMDPTNTDFLKRCESNPAIYTRMVRLKIMNTSRPRALPARS